MKIEEDGYLPFLDVLVERELAKRESVKVKKNIGEDGDRLSYTWRLAIQKNLERHSGIGNT